MVNKIKLLVAFLLLVAGIAGFYILAEAEKPMILRILAVLAGLAMAAGVLWTTPTGQKSLNFVGESVAEARKVVWPTRKETIQTTMVVFVLAVVMAIILGLIDVVFAYMVKWLMGGAS
ncbi:MAG TPA: preprotein translocase subunit SecE [Methylotenera sp.]|nr:preprotein translocase subunit SecE [Methylotenera sp.]HPN02086.1 preprotein translocase subunit SecE [Methylotenera sp.]